METEPTNSWRKIRISEVTFGEKTVTIVQVESFIAMNPQAGQERYAALSSFFEELVLIWFNGSRRHFYGNPTIVRRILRLPNFQLHWSDIPYPTSSHSNPQAPLRPPTVTSIGLN